MPKRGLGLSFGAHVYPFRLGRCRDRMSARSSSRRVAARRSKPATAGETPEGQRSTTRFSAFAPQVSLNFGTRKGWSYLSGGLGRAQFTTELQADPVAEATSKPGFNYGGGARWFAAEHVAFTFDIRFIGSIRRSRQRGQRAPGLRRTTIGRGQRGSEFQMSCQLTAASCQPGW